MRTFHVISNETGALIRPKVHQIGSVDVLDALRKGFVDFRDKPSHYVFLCLLYPIAGIVIMVWSAGANLLPLMFPLASGFALLGPLASIGLYEMSRRREIGLDAFWHHALDVRKSPAIYSILAAGGALLVLFVAWLKVAEALYIAHFGSEPPVSISAFLADVLTTPTGWSMIFWGNLAGLAFALAALAISVVTFPLLLDRDIGAFAAMLTSIRVFIRNPLPIILWGVIVAFALFLGSLPLFAGLAVVLPILGHATWHLYRKLIGPIDL